MARLENHFRGASCLQCFLPAFDAKAPTVSVFETGKQVIGAWSAEVVSSGFGEGEKIAGDYGADGMQSTVFGARSTIAVAIKAGEWGGAAALQIGAKDVGAHENRGVFWEGRLEFTKDLRWPHHWFTHCGYFARISRTQWLSLLIRDSMKTKFASLLSLGAPLWASLLFCCSSAAQQAPPPHGPPNPEERLNRMTKDLGLSAEQVAKLKPIFAGVDAKMKALHEDSSIQPDQKREKGREIMKESGPLIDAVLTPDQRTKFEEIRKKHKEDGPPPGDRKGPPPAGR